MARTIAQQFTPLAEAATHPFQHALATRSRNRVCVAHIVQSLSRVGTPGQLSCPSTEWGAFDNISRAAIFRGVADMPHRDKLIIVHPPVLFQSIEIFVGRTRWARTWRHLPGRG